jgi:hypothetical protein
MKNKFLIFIAFTLFFILVTGFSAKEYYNSTVENYVKQYSKQQTNTKYQYTKTVDKECKTFSKKNPPDWGKELTYLLEYNALSTQQSEYFDFTTETYGNRIKITAYRKKEYTHKTPLVSQSLLWDKSTEKPIFVRSHIIRKTWFYEQNIESKATFETENGQFYLKRTFQHFYTQIAFLKPREVVIFGNFTAQ